MTIPLIVRFRLVLCEILRLFLFRINNVFHTSCVIITRNSLLKLPKIVIKYVWEYPKDGFSGRRKWSVYTRSVAFTLVTVQQFKTKSTCIHYTHVRMFERSLSRRLVVVTRFTRHVYRRKIFRIVSCGFNNVIRLRRSKNRNGTSPL